MTWHESTLTHLAYNAKQVWWGFIKSCAQGVRNIEVNNNNMINDQVETVSKGTPWYDSDELRKLGIKEMKTEESS